LVHQSAVLQSQRSKEKNSMPIGWSSLVMATLFLGGPGLHAVMEQKTGTQQMSKNNKGLKLIQSMPQ